MSRNCGVTLIELIIVLIIIGIAAAFCLPNYTLPMEQANASNAQNNLLAIYAAQQNYNNNNGGNGTYCTTSTAPTECDSWQDINTVLSLNIQESSPSIYNYSCAPGPPPVCTATRNNSTSTPVIKVTLNSAVQLTGEVNPTCTGGNLTWCP